MISLPCSIWGDENPTLVVWESGAQGAYIGESARAGGSYMIAMGEANDQTSSLSDEEKARLTTWLIDQKLQGVTCPLITEGIIAYTKAKPPLSIPLRAVRLLQFIAKETSVIGISFDLRQEHLAAYAWSESTKETEVGFLVDFLLKKEWLEARPRVATVTYGEYELPNHVRVTVAGHGQIEQAKVNPDSPYAFIAMWFDETMDALFENGIAPAVREAGYEPVRIDRKLDVDKIDDAIIAEIRRSRFIVADFTHGKEGVRGGVYFEAGFAEGLGIHVFYTCRNDMIDKLHFDTRQRAHAVWETPEDLRSELKARIESRIGHGPNRQANP